MRPPRSVFLLLSLLLATPGAAQTWVDQTPASGDAPAPRAYAGAVYDAPAHRLVVFGGRGGDGDLNDVWAFDLADRTWTELTPSSGPAPAPRRTPGVGYDAENRRLLVWSGQGAELFSDVWAFDLESNTWTRFDPPAPRPNDRYGVASAFDPVGRRIVTFAGFTTQGRFEDTWAFDPAASAWSDLSAAATPGRRCLHAAAYDSRRHRLVIYGGQRTGPLDDVWALDLGDHAWTDLTPETRPAGRYFPALAYEARNDRLMLFGGNLGGSRSAEAWVFDLDLRTWQLLEPDGPAPTPREGASAIYVEAEDRLVVFGGRGAAYGNDVWTLEDLSVVTDAERETPPRALDLSSAYPHPVRGTAAFHVVLPAGARTTVAVYDALGRKVAELVDRVLPAGRHTVAWDAAGRPAGTYVVHLRAGDAVRTRSVVVAR